MPRVKRSNTTVKTSAKPRKMEKIDTCEEETSELEKMEVEEGMAELTVANPSAGSSASSSTKPSGSKKTKLKRAATMRISVADSNNNRNSSLGSNIKRPKPERFTTFISHEHEKGTLYAFGINDTSQLGLPSANVEQRKFPALVPGMRDLKVIQTAAGAMHTVVLTQDNKVYTFGCNDDYALGRNTEQPEDSEADEDLATPGHVPFNKKIVQVTAGDSHSAALTEDGRVYFWGSFRNGAGDIGLQPGTGKVMNPTLISYCPNAEPKIVKLASGYHHIVALSSDGEVFTLGDGECGQLGRFVSERALRSRTLIPRSDAFLRPEKVISSFMKHVCDIWAGGNATFCKTKQLRDDGTSFSEIWSFGLNASSQLGWPSKQPQDAEEALTFDNTKNCHFIPKKSPSFNSSAAGWKQICTGQHHTIALSEAGQVFALGGGKEGQLGLGDTDEAMTEKPVPTIIPTLREEKCVQIACGGSTSYAITDSRKLYAWGFGVNYQLANGEEEDEQVPFLCKASRNEDGIPGRVVYVSAGSQHVAIITQPPASQ